jgi:hypothetical protein
MSRPRSESAGVPRQLLLRAGSILVAIRGLTLGSTKG